MKHLLKCAVGMAAALAVILTVSCKESDDDDVTPTPSAVSTIDLSTVTIDITVADGYTLTGTLNANVKVTIADGATVTLDGVVISGTDEEDYTWAGITCEGDATIVLKEGSSNSVKGFQTDYPGIYVPGGKTLAIQGSGSLTRFSSSIQQPFPLRKGLLFLAPLRLEHLAEELIVSPFCSSADFFI